MKKLLLLVVVLLAGGFSATSSPIALKGYFSCAGAVIEGTDKGLACYARTQSSCRNGTVVLAYEQLANQAKGQLANSIIDTVHGQVNRAEQAVEITTCAEPGGARRGYFVLISLKQPGEYLRGIQRAWTYNAQDELVEVPLKMAKCLNNDYGAD